MPEPVGLPAELIGGPTHLCSPSSLVNRSLRNTSPGVIGKWCISPPKTSIDTFCNSKYRKESVNYLQNRFQAQQKVMTIPLPLTNETNKNT